MYDVNTNQNVGAVEKQKGAILQTRGLYVSYTDNVKVETSHLLGTWYGRFSYSIE